MTERIQALLLGILMMVPQVLLALPDGSAAKELPLSLGVLAPLTGDYASAGEEIKRGVELATEILGERGIKTEIIFEDACLPAQGVAAIKKLIEFNKIRAVTSNYCVITLNAIVPIVNKHKVIVFQNSVSPVKLFATSEYFYTTWPAIEEEVGAIVADLSDEQVTRAGILYLESPWGIAYAEAFRDQVRKRKGKVVVDLSQGFGSHDFRSEVTRLKSMKATSMLVAHTGSNLVSFLKQAATMEIPTNTIFVPSDAEDMEIIKAAAPAGNGIGLFSTELEHDTSGRNLFRQRYRGKYNREPAPLGRHAFDQVMVVSIAFKECAMELSCVQAKLLQLSDYDGASGTFTMKSNRLAKREFARKTAYADGFRFEKNK
jgi:branched-chain amino acid transport system substrate-binding protein